MHILGCSCLSNRAAISFIFKDMIGVDMLIEEEKNKIANCDELPVW